MCSVTAATAIGTLVVTAVGTAVTAYGQSQQSNAIRDAAAVRASVDANNQELARRAAQRELQSAEVAASKRQREGAQLKGRQRAILAANGVLVDEGSALELTLDTDQVTALDVATIRNNAQLAAQGFQIQGINYGLSSEANRLQAESEAAANRVRLFSTALTGAKSVATKWYQFDQAGNFNSLADPFGTNTQDTIRRL